ncbi:unnamed protein product [Choristocarpus tenellus]
MFRSFPFRVACNAFAQGETKVPASVEELLSPTGMVNDSGEGRENFEDSTFTAETEHPPPSDGAGGQGGHDPEGAGVDLEGCVEPSLSRDMGPEETPPVPDPVDDTSSASDPSQTLAAVGVEAPHVEPDEGQIQALTPTPESTPSSPPSAFATLPPASSARVVGYATPSVSQSTEPHLKTGGEVLIHTNRAESPVDMSSDLLEKLRLLKLRRRHRYVVMRIDGTQVVAESVGEPAAGPTELKESLPYSDCRYAVYDLAYTTHDGRKTNKLLFFSWLPHNATPHNKMAYSHGKVTVRQQMSGLHDVMAGTFEDVDVALGVGDDDGDESDIDF